MTTLNILPWKSGRWFIYFLAFGQTPPPSTLVRDPPSATPLLIIHHHPMVRQVPVLLQTEEHQPFPCRKNWKRHISDYWRFSMIMVPYHPTYASIINWHGSVITDMRRHSNFYFPDNCQHRDCCERSWVRNHRHRQRNLTRQQQDPLHHWQVSSQMSTRRTSLLNVVPLPDLAGEWALGSTSRRGFARMAQRRSVLVGKVYLKAPHCRTGTGGAFFSDNKLLFK